MFTSYDFKHRIIIWGCDFSYLQPIVNVEMMSKGAHNMRLYVNSVAFCSNFLHFKIIFGGKIHALMKC